MIPIAVIAWLILLAATLAAPFALGSSTPGDDLTRYTIRLSLFYYALAATLMLLLRGDEWTAINGRGRLARLLWTFAWATYLVHLAMAFHFYHYWSHADAMEHTREVSGIAEGIFVSHLFTLAWTADVLAWWLRPAWYARRPAWIGWLLHGFMVFIIFNGTVVYETGLIRWAGVAMFGELAGVAAYRMMTRMRARL
jgi:hypothetical protein